MKTAHFFIAGVVQKIGFRSFARDSAVKLGLKGVVRNMKDGRVEVVAQGDAEAMESLERLLWRGARDADVFSVDVEWADEPAFMRFDIEF